MGHTMYQCSIGHTGAAKGPRAEMEPPQPQSAGDKDIRDWIRGSCCSDLKVRLSIQAPEPSSERQPDPPDPHC